MRTIKRGAGRVRCGLALTAVGAMAVTALGVVPTASATVGPAGIAAGKNITVFHNIDFVATFGWNAGDAVTIEVFRNDVLIGSAAGQAFDTPEGGALEVNHGPEGAPAPGDCWDGHTPDVRPGDLVRVTGGGTTSEVIVDDLLLNDPATLAANGDVEVRGHARTAAGAAIPLADLNSGEFRTVLPNGQFRANPASVVADPAGGVGGFIMRYPSPYNGFRQPADSTPTQRRDALLGDDGHAAGFGHVAPLPDEAQIVEGYGDTPGPALGCEGSPSALDAVTSTNHEILNVATTSGGGSLEIGGVSFDATAVSVTVGGLPATVSGPTPATGHQTWTASIPMSQVLTLPDGNVTVAMTATKSATPLAGASKVLVKDVVAPVAPAFSPNGGSFVGSLNVFATPAAGETLRYGVGAPLVASPIAGLPFPGSLLLNSTQTLHLFAVDGAGNVSPVTSRTFTRTAPPIGTPPPGAGAGAILPLAPSIAKAKSGKRGGVKTAKARWRAPQANGAVIDGYRVRAFKIRPGKSAKKVKAVRIGANRTRVKMVLPRGTYRFQVRASSTAGKSSWSARSNKVRSR